MNWKAPLECWELAEDQVLLKLADAFLVCLRAAVILNETTYSGSCLLAKMAKKKKKKSDSVILAGSKIACRE